MTIQMTISEDGETRKTTTYRNVVRGVNLAQYREGFFAQEQTAKWGTLVQLRGKERIVLGRFGTQDDEE